MNIPGQDARGIFQALERVESARSGRTFVYAIALAQHAPEAPGVIAGRLVDQRPRGVLLAVEGPDGPDHRLVGWGEMASVTLTVSQERAAA